MERMKFAYGSISRRPWLYFLRGQSLPWSCEFLQRTLSKQLLLVLPQEDCLFSVKLNSLQASEETTSSLTVKPSEPQASCCLCYKTTWGGRPDLAHALSLGRGSFFFFFFLSPAFTTCPEFKNKFGPGVIVGSGMHWRLKKKKNRDNPLLVLPSL